MSSEMKRLNILVGLIFIHRVWKVQVKTQHTYIYARLKKNIKKTCSFMLYRVISEDYLTS